MKNKITINCFIIFCLVFLFLLFIYGIADGAELDFREHIKDTHYSFACVSAEIPKDNWSIYHVNSEETKHEDNSAVNAVDGNTKTMWHTDWGRTNKHPHEIQINLGKEYLVNGLQYLPRQIGERGKWKN